jgi:ribosome-associated translation inhibitor RaiA
MKKEHQGVISELINMIDNGSITNFPTIIPSYIIFQYNKTIIKATYLVTGKDSSSREELYKLLTENVGLTLQLIKCAEQDLSKQEGGSARLEHWPPLLILESFLNKNPEQGTVAWSVAHAYSTMTVLSLLFFKRSLAGIETNLRNENYIEAYQQTQTATSHIHTAMEAGHKSESILYSAREETLSRIATKDEIEIQIEIDKNREAKSKGGQPSPYKAIHKEINEIMKTALKEGHKYDYIRGEIQEAAVKGKLNISTTCPDNKTLKIWKDKLKQTGYSF